MHVVAGALRLRVVGGGPLRQQLETGAAVQVILEQRLELLLSFGRRVRHADAEHDNAGEAGRSLFGRQVDAEGHAHGQRALEVEHPADRVGDLKVVAVRLELLVAGATRVRADGERRLDDPALLLDLQCLAAPRHEHQPFGQQPHARRPRPRRAPQVEIRKRREPDHRDLHAVGRAGFAGAWRLAEVDRRELFDNAPGRGGADLLFERRTGRDDGRFRAPCAPHLFPELGGPGRCVGRGNDHQQHIARLAALRLVRGIQGHVMLDDPARAPDAMRARQVAPRRALLGIHSAGPPDTGPEGLRVPRFGFGERRLERFRQALVRVDAHPQLCLSVDRLEPRFESQREEQNRMAIRQAAQRVPGARELAERLPQAERHGRRATPPSAPARAGVRRRRACRA